MYNPKIVDARYCVIVMDLSGRVLNPCRHFAAKRLLASGQAVELIHYPQVIQLKRIVPTKEQEANHE